MGWSASHQVSGGAVQLKEQLQTRGGILRQTGQCSSTTETTSLMQIIIPRGTHRSADGVLQHAYSNLHPPHALHAYILLS